MNTSPFADALDQHIKARRRFTYSPAGTVTSISDLQHGRLTYTNDALGHVTTITPTTSSDTSGLSQGGVTAPISSTSTSRTQPRPSPRSPAAGHTSQRTNSTDTGAQSYAYDASGNTININGHTASASSPLVNHVGPLPT